MIKTSISHAIIATIISMIGLLLGNLYAGIAFGLAFYLGREVAQHERKEAGDNPLRGFYVWNWSLDARLDMLAPIIATIIIVLINFKRIL